jgi:hypothetical protein
VAELKGQWLPGAEALLRRCSRSGTSHATCGPPKARSNPIMS